MTIQDGSALAADRLAAMVKGLSWSRVSASNCSKEAILSAVLYLPVHTLVSPPPPSHPTYTLASRPSPPHPSTEADPLPIDVACCIMPSA